MKGTHVIQARLIQPTTAHPPAGPQKPYRKDDTRYQTGLRLPRSQADHAAHLANGLSAAFCRKENALKRRGAISLQLFFVLAFAALLPLQTAQAEDYLIGNQDALKITVFEHPDLATVVRVDEYGRIRFPLIGELQVKGLGVRQIEQAIAARLAEGKYISNPQVTVFIEQYRGQRVTVIGEVTRPGQYEITGPTTVLDAVSMALGMTKDAGHTITLLRKDLSAGEALRQQKISIDLDNLFKDGNLGSNMQLRDKDVLYIPRIEFFYIYGEVNRPGVYRIERGLTVKRAISIAGGFTAKAAKKNIEITRRQEGKDSIREGSIDEPVAADDVIMIRESIF